ncbi:Alpha/Beta hydrolase protein [Crepidotus variabilis]|uniref:Alpha/Beta hydrolase protein n=1 Tax=Crepidotus variabilis TaxID=179855 RepID=A0A9P6JV98_9AGAR|nr:Alpha/Beta hydrolase protein [Crepidotus variabilis]
MAHWRAEQQARMYALEKLDNFRWISNIMAGYGRQELSEDDVVPETTLQYSGQFSEIVYSSVSPELLIKHYEILAQPEFPLEHFNALRDCITAGSYRGTLADVPTYIFIRRNSGQTQLVVSICGTASPDQFRQDLRVLKTPHRSGHGNAHTGFLALYDGIKADLMKGIQDLVITGHSMEGSIAYLLCLDLLADYDAMISTLRIRIVSFGAPRTGDTQLVNYFHTKVEAFWQRSGRASFVEYAVKGYSDGIPAVPPVIMGYQHFCEEPFYSAYGRLYRVPTADSEYATFRFKDGENQNRTLFPQGSHNYYNSRDLEGFRRKLDWLVEAKFPEPGWEDHYRDKLRDSNSRS